MKTIVTSPEFDYLGDELLQGSDLSRARVDIKNFSDAWPHIEVVKEDIENKVVTVLLDFSDPKNFFLNYAVLQGLVDYKAESLNIIMPYFPVGTMERVGKKGEVATAHSFARILSTLPPGKSGRKNDLHIFDIHAEVEEYLFDNRRLNVELHTAFALLKEKIEGKTVVFPDAGAAKRFEHIFDDHDRVVCSKKREEGKRIITMNQGDPFGKDVIIVDDLIETGGTLIETAKVLRELGATSVSAFATHGVFPGGSHIRVAQNVDTLIVSDSVPINNQRAEGVKNMEVISLKEGLKDII